VFWHEFKNMFWETKVTTKFESPGSRYSDSLGAGRSGHRILKGPRCSAFVYTGPGVYSSLLYNGYRVCVGGGGLPPSPSGTSWSVSGRTLPYLLEAWHEASSMQMTHKYSYLSPQLPGARNLCSPGLRSIAVDARSLFFSGWNVVCNGDWLNTCPLACYMRSRSYFGFFSTSQLFQLVCFCAVELAVLQTESISQHFSVLQT
jgi:hypothetical protein